MSKTTTNYVETSLQIFKDYKRLAEKAMEQLTDEELFHQPDEESNSVYLIMKHLAGNMKSRWTNFLTEDGEKPWRNRDTEFEQDKKKRDEVLQMWNEGWQCVFDVLETLTPDDLSKTVYIRSEPHSVMEAINRQVAHYSYHVGQIVFLSKAFKTTNWKTLSIAKGKSKEFNEKLIK